MVAWRSQETAYHMEQKFPKQKKKVAPKKKKTKADLIKDFINEADGVPTEPEEEQVEYEYEAGDRSIYPNLPDHFFNEKGELDLRGVTGVEAANFMRKVTGNRLSFPMMSPPPKK